MSTEIQSAETIATDVAMTTVIVHFRRICQYLPRRQVQDLQLVQKLWYETLVPGCYDSCKVRFEMENIFARAVFVQYYEGCLMWIDIASYVED